MFRRLAISTVPKFELREADNRADPEVGIDVYGHCHNYVRSTQ